MYIIDLSTTTYQSHVQSPPSAVYFKYSRTLPGRSGTVSMLQMPLYSENLVILRLNHSRSR
ncbi:hypothetical protein PM082_016809 [Marasmius tenuissimus]|nr:hypothetical protein PM082_016809 [Marasmius tenuissimus]